MLTTTVLRTLSKYLIGLLCCIPLMGWATNSVENSQERYLTEVLEEISEKYQVFFTYNKSLLKDVRVEYDINKEATLETTINQILVNTQLRYQHLGSNYYVIFQDDKSGQKSLKKFQRKINQLERLERKEGINLNYRNTQIDQHLESVAQTVQTRLLATITGTITDETGTPLQGATVRAKGTNQGALTDGQGKYQLTVSDEVTTLLFSYIGYETKEVEIGGRTVIDIVLSEAVSELDEVIVTGYGRQVKRDVTGSIASLSAQKIKDLPVTSFENAIQGQLAGVQVSETSGEPGAGPTIRVRGIGSITAGNEPLYVIDGFPVSKNVDLGIQGDNFRRGAGRFRPPTQNPLGTLNPNDIASIQVLKDASAASIYGSRGSNGVVLITTKKGNRSGEPVVTYDGYVGVQSVANRLDLMNSAEFIEYNKEATNNAYLQNGPAGSSASDPNSQRSNAAWRIADDMQNPDGTDTDWQDLLFGNAVIQSHNLGISGGAKNVGYYVAANYYNQDGIIDKSGFDRYSLRMNLEADVSDKFRIGLNMNPSYTSSDKLPAGSPYFARPPGIVYSGIVHSPTVRPYNADGTINQLDNQSYLLTSDGAGSSLTSASNPLAIIEAIDDKLNQFRTFTNLYAEYDIIEGLTFKTFVGIDINNYKRNFFRKNSLLYRTATSGEPYGQSSSSESVSWLTEQTLSYSKTFSSDHAINAVAGYTAQKEQIDINTVIADNFPDDLVPTVSGGQVVQGTAAKEEWSLVSMLARVNYDYKDRFLVTASIRSDRSSRFGAGNKTGIFPSVSAGWRISQGIESDWLSDLKARASWGKTGNFLIPNYASIGLLGQDNYIIGGNLVNGIAPSTISNQDLSWEKTSSYDVGLDFGFWDDRIYGSVEYFNSTTTDLLLAVQIPSALGFTNGLTNIGEVVNQGFELSLTSRNMTGRFLWTTDINFATIDNEVTKLGDSGDPILSSGGAGNRHITRIGDPVGSYFGYVTDGIYQNQSEIDAGPVDQIATPRPGDFRWMDINKDGVINASDRTAVGNYLPDFTYGITNTMSFQHVMLSFLIQGVEGVEVLNLTRRHMGNGEANYNSYKEWVNRWQSPENPGNGEIPRANRQTGNSNNRPSNYQVEDASYIRLRNVTLSYTFQQKTLGDAFSALRIYVSGTNLLTLTDYLGFNPEVNNNDDNVNVQGEDYGAYPLSRVFSFGVNASF